MPVAREHRGGGRLSLRVGAVGSSVGFLGTAGKEKMKQVEVESSAVV
jgi:hypothetical protein